MSDQSQPPDPNQTGSEHLQDPDNWTTKNDPPTEKQAAYLRVLANQTNEDVDDPSTKAEASKEIDRLQGERDESPNHSSD